MDDDSDDDKMIICEDADDVGDDNAIGMLISTLHVFAMRLCM